MAINLATKYSPKIAQLFTQKSVVDGRTNTEYDFTGVKGLKIYTPVTQSMNDYARTGTNRYGTPSEVQDTVQELIMAKDRSFSLTVDRGNNSEQLDIKSAGKILKQEMDEQVIPEIDKYALAKFAEHAAKVDVLSTAPTKTTITGLISDGMVYLSNKKVPAADRTIYIAWSYFGMLRLAPEYVGNDKLGSKILATGQLGEYMSAAVIPVPDEYLKRNNATQAYFLIAYKKSVIQAKKIQDYFVKQNPPGINGALLEGRFIYDAFVLGAKADGVYVAVAADGQQAAPTNTYTAATKTMAIASTGANTIKYTTDGTDPRYSATANVGSSVELTKFAGTTVTFKSVAFDDDLYTSNVTTTTQAVAA